MQVADRGVEDPQPVLADKLGNWTQGVRIEWAAKSWETAADAAELCSHLKSQCGYQMNESAF